MSKNNQRKTHKEYVEELRVKNPGIEVIGEYINAKTPIRHHCLIHDIYWDISPTNILCGQGCKECGRVKMISKQTKSDMEYRLELEKINQNIKALDTYISARKKILHICQVCGHKWEVAPSDILSGKGCPMCAGNIRKTQEEYEEQVARISPHIIVIGEYKNMVKPILHKCITHNIVWDAAPSSILRGSGCKECGKEKVVNSIKKSHDKYVKEVSEINDDIIVVGEYVDWKTPILHRCRIDGNEWYARPNNILNGCGCPVCNSSKGETLIARILDDNNIRYVKQKRFIACHSKKSLPFDFYLPERNSCIEYDGKQHFEPIDHFGGEQSFYERKLHDKIKDDYCKEHGVKLLRIPYYKDVEEELNNFLFT